MAKEELENALEETQIPLEGQTHPVSADTPQVEMIVQEENDIKNIAQAIYDRQLKPPRISDS